VKRHSLGELVLLCTDAHAETDLTAWLSRPEASELTQAALLEAPTTAWGVRIIEVDGDRYEVRRTFRQHAGFWAVTLTPTQASPAAPIVTFVVAEVTGPITRTFRLRAIEVSPEDRR
jgi:hypothetical protein